MTVLSERMALVNEHYAFNYFDTFVYDGANRIFFSLCSENDILLTINTDENGKITLRIKSGAEIKGDI